MTIAQGINKQLIVKKQSALGTAASGSGAQILRRTSSTIDLTKENYTSNEIRTSQQHADFRLGGRSVSGTVSGELSVGSYQKFMESVLRQAAAGVTTITGLTITSAVTAGVTGKGTFTRASGSWITDGIKLGHVVRFAGFTGGYTDNNSHNFLVIALTATVMTGVMLDSVPVVAATSQASISCSIPGKVITIPQSGHTMDYWTIEHNFADLVQSEQFVDCVIGGMNLKLPASGMSTVDFTVVGLDMTTGTSSVFTSPTAESTTGILASVNGALYLDGAVIGNITSIDIAADGKAAALGAVVGTNASPDVSRGSISISGSMTGMFNSVTMRNLFINETECVLSGAFTTSNSGGADFIAIHLPAVIITSASKDDGEKGIMQTFNFTATEYTGGASNSQTSSIVIQDSAAT